MALQINRRIFHDAILSMSNIASIDGLESRINDLSRKYNKLSVDK